MTVLDTLYIVYKSLGIDELERDEKRAKKTTDDLAHSLENTGKISQNLSNQFIGLAKSIGGFVLAGLSVGHIYNSVKAAGEYAREVGDAARSLKVNVEELDVWDRAVKEAGGSAQGFQSSVRNLASALNITTKDALSLMPRLADTFRKVGQDRALAFGKKIGLDEGTILFLQQGRREIDALLAKQKEFGTVTKQDAELVRKFNNEWEKTTYLFRYFYLQISTAVLPFLIKLVEGFEKVGLYFKKHSDFIKGGLIALAGIITYLVTPALVRAAVAAWGFMAPLLPMIVALAVLSTAFALVYDDIQNFLKGNRSVTGEILERWPVVGKVIKTVFDGIKETLKFVMQAIDAVVEGFKKVSSFLTGNNNGVTLDGLLSGQQAIKLASNNRLASQSSGSIFSSSRSSNRNNSINMGEINIYTQATDGYGIASALKNNLFSDQMRQTVNGMDDGVLG